MRGWLSLIVASLLVSGVVHAEEVGVLEIIAPGLPEAAVSKFEDSVVDGLQGADFEVKKRKQFVAELRKGTWVVGCNFGPCVTQVYKATGVELALVVRVQGEGSSYTFIASLIDTRSGHLKAQAKRDCAACSVNDAVMEASMLGGELRAGLALAEDGNGSRPGSVVGSASAKAESRRSGLRTTSYLFLVAGLAAGGVGGYFLYDDDRDKGLPLVAGGGAAFLAGVTMFAFSREF
ncbi:MAG: hypothetical protein KJO07_07395 [Deltaproteobacteria bacterium]|nr:hypothetical protein [Deltaproteobacteria bacterium]